MRADSVRHPANVPGEVARATPTERDLLVDWQRTYTREAMPDEFVPGHAESMIDWILGQPDGGLRLWVRDGVPVSMAYVGHQTPHGERISNVYTPVEFRRNGYAAALVAEVTQERLRLGRQFLTLYADVANATTNHIYREIGYRPIARSPQYQPVEQT